MRNRTLKHSARRPLVAAGLTFMVVAGVYGQETTESVAPADKAAVSVPTTKRSDEPVAKRVEEPKVTFDEKDPAIVYFETNGEKYRVNTITKKMERVSDAVAVSSAAPQPPASSAATEPQDEKEDLYKYEAGDEPYDYRLVNVPTPKKVPKGTWNLSFTHRFSQPVNPVSESGKALFGLDSFSVSSFGIAYGITDKFYVSGYRSPVCQRGLCRTIEVGFGYHFTDQDEHSPVALSAYASVEGNENFSKQYTYNLQTMISHRVGRRLFFFFSPAVHLNANGGRRFDPKATDYFPPATIANSFRLPRNGASFGLGASFRITPSVTAMFEYTPRTGFKLGRLQTMIDRNFNVVGFRNQSYNEVGLGLQYNIGKHFFNLTFSNTQTTTTSRYNSSNLALTPRHLIIGFNLFRRW